MTAPNFQVSITARDLTRDLTLKGLTFTVQRYSWAIDSGPRRCTIRVDGSYESLKQLRQGLRGNLTIKAGAAESVWWGCLWEVEIHVGRIVEKRTLEQMGNSIDIQYLLQSVNQTYSGAGSKATTGFSSDTDSVAEYGTIQRRLRGSNGSATAATSRRSRELALQKSPRKTRTIAPQAGESYAMIYGRSWFDTLDWLYYTNETGNAAGFEENNVLTDEVPQGMGSRGSVIATDYTFTSNKTIQKSFATMLTGVGSYIFITGTNSNNNIDWVVAAVPGAGGHIEVTPATVTTEAAGDTVSLWEMGQKIYQTFEVTTEFYAAAIDIRVGKNQTPADDVTIKLYTDSSVTPDTLLATGTIANAEIGSYGWHTAVLDAQIQLSPGTTYGIEISRSGSTTNTDSFSVGLDTGLNYASGSLKLYGNATIGWKVRPVDADLIFKVAGVVETTTQISSIIADVGEFITTANIVDASGLRVVPYQDGTLTIKRVIDNLAKYGTSNARRLLLSVTESRVLSAYEEPQQNTAADIHIGLDGIPRNVSGEPLPLYKCPHGQWVRWDYMELEKDTAEIYDFIDEAEYNAVNDSWQVVRWRDSLAQVDLMGLRE